MAEPGPDALRGRRLLVVEDEYLIAVSLARSLEGRGAEVVGPAGSVRGALAPVGAGGAQLDGGVLEITVRDERGSPVAAAFAARALPFVFLTGYDAQLIPDAYAGAPRCEKPASSALLARILSKALHPFGNTA